MSNVRHHLEIHSLIEGEVSPILSEYIKHLDASGLNETWLVNSGDTDKCLKLPHTFVSYLNGLQYVAKAGIISEIDYSSVFISSAGL